MEFRIANWGWATHAVKKTEAGSPQVILTGGLGEATPEPRQMSRIEHPGREETKDEGRSCCQVASLGAKGVRRKLKLREPTEP